MRSLIKYQISTDTAISLHRVLIFFPLQMWRRTEAITEQHHHRPLVPPPLLPQINSHLHTISRFLLSTAAFLPGPRLRMGCVPMPGDAIRAWSPVLVLCSRVGPTASVTSEQPWTVWKDGRGFLYVNPVTLHCWRKLVFPQGTLILKSVRLF